MKRKGFSFVEMLIVIVLLGVVSLGLFVLLKTPTDVNAYSQREFDVQAGIRLVAGTIDQSVKNATAVFLLTKKDEHFNNEWNYFVCDEKDGKSRVVLHEWKKGKFETRILAEHPSDEVKYSIGFQKVKNTNLLKFQVLAQDFVRNKSYDISSELKILNSNSIVDQSKMDYTLTPPQKMGNCLAFRSDLPNPDLKNDGYHHVSISFILDTSGSMRWNMDGAETPNHKLRRIWFLKEELKKFFKTLEKEDTAGIVDVRLYPFSTTVFEKNDSFKPGKTYGSFLNIKEKTELNSEYFNQLVDKINIEGGTNVGDGIRFAYHGILNYDKEKRSSASGDGTPGKNKRIKHYLFVLTDGRPTFFSYTKNPGKLKPGEYDSEKFYNEFAKWMYFVYSDRAVDNSLVKYAGGGNRLSADEAEIIYIERLGEKMVSKFPVSPYPGEPIDVTVVGFSNNSDDKIYCNRIGKSLGAEKGSDNLFYKDCTSGDALKAVFKSFSESVVANTLWYIAGPQ